MKAANLAETATQTIDGIADTIAPIADVLGPLVGPQLAVALPWLSAGLVVAVPVAVALWPVLYKIAEVIPGTLDTWLLDRVGAVVQRLAKWLLRKDVRLVPTGELTDKDVADAASEVVEQTSDKLKDKDSGQ